nr:uncharacterized protein LOC111418634 [Onthophagus taurus]XP_022907015.1 uncharacterized protein LOC111418634 [Onthophagus taurus]XP_022907016.1 uncharacterized protein LOC111418634 [Onthophagus taurus]XP_022907018.1 uncharacterized protein LOC111418634 [Onthophagus taurus]XP_022907019.1 uncharacterized protein LOC111418634 [Onthophagus taurus]XP_022907020.1 uncharacterized protein LOC111418634 [Onthophagus taurus]XP_022907021.1 uncharacterized protein LOC111418634 [Onthophagus taurus]XP_0
MHRRQSGLKAFRDGSNRLVANKQTNTPNNFVLCSLCEEKFNPKNLPNGCLGDQERSIREYSNALDYINSCHSIINHMMAQNKEFKESFVAMPNVPNFLELFSVLLTQDFESKRHQKEVFEPRNTRSGIIKKNDDGHNRLVSDSETSDFESEVFIRASKTNLQKFKSKLPRTEETIYEEENQENVVTKRSKSVKKSPTSSPQRSMRYSDATLPSTQEVSNKRSKPRSYSANAPRTKNVIEKKSGHDLSGNYSDTVISGSCKQSDLTQQDLDKYAKELLGSEQGTPIHSPRSTSPHNRTPNNEKSPTRSTRKSPKPTSPNQSGHRYTEILKTRYSDTQHRQNATLADSSKPPSLQKVTHTMEATPSQNLDQNGHHNQNIRRQNQIKRQKPSVSQSMTDQQSPSRSQPIGVKISSQPGSNYAFFGKEKIINEEVPYEMQDFAQINKNRAKISCDKDQDVYEGRKVNLRTTPSKLGVQKGKLKEQFNMRKLSPSDMKIIESQVKLFVGQHVNESDGIKTDSDIEEDCSKKQVEDRPVRISDERPPKNFRRKQSESEDDEVVKFPEEHAYSTTTDGYQRIHQIGNNQKKNAISDESSDIKSDDDVVYDQRNSRPVNVHRRTTGNYPFNYAAVRH